MVNARFHSGDAGLGLISIPAGWNLDHELKQDGTFVMFAYNSRNGDYRVLQKLTMTSRSLPSVFPGLLRDRETSLLILTQKSSPMTPGFRWQKMITPAITISRRPFAGKEEICPAALRGQLEYVWRRFLPG